MSEDWQAGGSLGDILAELGKEGHLTVAQVKAVLMLLHDMRTHHGSTHGLISVPSERVQASFRLSQIPAFLNIDSHNRMQSMLDGLHAHERELLNFLVRSRELPRGGLSDWGRTHSAYSNAKQSRACAVGQVRSLAQSIAEQVHEGEKV